MLLGITSGTIAYRSEYAAVLDFQRNHIPLPLFRSHTQIYCKPGDIAENTHVLDINSRKATDKVVLWNWWKGASAGEMERTKERDYLTGLRKNERTPPSKTLPLWVPKTLDVSIKRPKQNATLGASGGSTVRPRAPSIILAMSASPSPSLGASPTIAEVQSAPNTTVVLDTRNKGPSPSIAPSRYSLQYPASGGSTRSSRSLETPVEEFHAVESSELAYESNISFIPRDRPRSAPPEIEPVVKWATWSSHI